MNPSELRDELRLLVKTYPRPQAALVPLLHALLDAEGGVPNDLLEPLAEVCEVDVATIKNLIEYYPIFRRHEQHCPALCLDLTCYLSGAKEIYDRLKAEPSLIGDGISEITASRCVGYCYAAPVLKLNDETFYKIIVTTQPSSSSRDD